MRLATEIQHRIDNPNLSSNERALLRCRLARHLEEAGDYEAAREAMGKLWQRVGERPLLDGLDERTKAEVLLRAGALTGWIGSTKQIENSQETAKDLLTESILLFQALGVTEGAAAAQTDLAYCYWREGGFSEARVMLQEALTNLGDVDNETKAVALLRSAIVEMSARRFHDALRIHTQAAPLFEKIRDHLLRAKFHNGLANVLNFLSTTEYREDYIDQALLEYTAASFHFEQAEHPRYEACVENNLGFLFSTIGKFEDAHEHLDRAQVLLTRLKDDLHLAQVDQTRARVMLAEGRVVEAEKTVGKAVRTLEKGDELSLLAEALTTHGVALARLHHPEMARAALRQAANVAERAGDVESAGVAALNILEELGQDFSGDDACAIDHAKVLLDKTQDMAIVRRLASAALSALRDILAPPEWSNFSLQRAVLRYEGHWIKLALKETGGMVTPAARLLGLKSHQTLIHLIKVRHKELVNTRLAVRKRRKHIFSKSRKIKKNKGSDLERAASQIRILHVEDNKAVASLVKETLELEGWKIETCADGNLALEGLASDAHYDLILLDNDLPGLNGLELVERARTMAHRRDTPVVMLSATVDNAAARQAGADVGLHKPEEIGSLADTVARLLKIERAADRSFVREG
jgi:two-component system, chemotaxis family, chemotaxis protein CheY